MSYAYVENNEIKEIHYFLPKNWRNISNFNILNDEELLNFNWYKLIEYIPEYNTATHEPYGEEIVFEDGVAKRKYVIREKIIPIEEPINFEQTIAENVIPQTTDNTTSN